MIDAIVSVVTLMLLACMPQDGYISAYAKRPTDATLAYRLNEGHDLSRKYNIAVQDCSYVGGMALVISPNGSFEANIFDCAGKEDGGASWMASNNIVAEVGWYAWQTFPSLVHGHATVLLCPARNSLTYRGENRFIPPNPH